MLRTHAWAMVLVLPLLGARPGYADSAIDGIEHVFGATNINAVTGNGRMAAGVSATGEITVLSWPSPSYADQLGYISSNDFHARSLPRFGAPEGAGLFLGLLLERSGGQRTVSWLRDPSQWVIEQSYGTDDGPNVVTQHRSADLGLTVTVTDAIRPAAGAADVLARTVVVERASGSPIRMAWLLTYANLSPTPPNSRIPEIPIVDWAFDGSNDYAALWDATASAVIHFHPNDQLIFHELTDLLTPPRVAYGPIGEQLHNPAPVAEAIAALSATLDASYAPGSYLALSTRPAPDQHQIGYDATPLCAARDAFADNIVALPEVLPGAESPIDPSVVSVFRCPSRPPAPEREGWAYEAEDALHDAGDGELQGSDLAAGEVNEALRTPLPLSASGASIATVEVVLAAGPTAAQARAAVATGGEPGAVARAAAATTAAWLATVRLPESAPAEVRTVARRALMNLRVGTDAATGAIVASISRQPPYYLDWPRDGAFFNVALDVSGQSTLASRRADLSIAWQRMRPVHPSIFVDQAPPADPTTGEARFYPADSWEMNYYPDGMIGGPLRFEIDNAALAIWSIVTHAGWVADPATYLSARWDPIARGTNLLARWRDPVNGLQAPASEDDNAAYTQTLHGAVTVFAALDVAARAARLLGRDVQALRWEARACELRQAMLTHLYDAAARRFVRAPGDSFDPERAPTGDTAWLVWPARVLPWDDTRIGEQVTSDLERITPTVRLEDAGGAYFMKNTVATGLARGTDPIIGPRIADLRDRLARTHATPATHHFGEAMLVVDGPEGPVASQRVATPHLWEGILFYLTAMALDDPQAFDRYDGVLPASRVPLPEATCPVAPVCAGDCNDDGVVTIDELLAGAAIVLGERTVDSCPAVDANGDGAVTIDELIRAVRHALAGCGD